MSSSTSAMRYFAKGGLEYDGNSVLRATGRIDQVDLHEVLQRPYFIHDIPMTTGRETFGDSSAEDIYNWMLRRGASPGQYVLTIIRITAQSLVEYDRRHGPNLSDEISMGRGGSYDPNIVKYPEKQIPNKCITTVEEIGIPVGAKEASNLPFLGCKGFVGRPVMVLRGTESGKRRVIKQMQPGPNHFRIRPYVTRFWGGLPGGESCSDNEDGGGKVVKPRLCVKNV